jgi:hypothetical protein
MYNLFLDDVRIPKNVTLYDNDPIYNELNWIIVRSHNELMDYIKKNGIPKLISFDHDLADVHYLHQNNINYKEISVYEKTGYDSLKWVCYYTLNNKLKLPIMLFHTANSVGKKNMIFFYKTFIKHYPELL